MKKFVILFLLLTFISNLLANKIIRLSDLKKPYQIAVFNNKLYVFDEADYELFIYNIDPIALNLKLGKRGNGLYDFKYLPNVFVEPSTFLCTDFTKTIWYSEAGKIIKLKEYSDFVNFDLNSEMLLISAHMNYLRIIVDHDNQRRHVYLLNSKFETMKKLFEGPFIWKKDEQVGYRTHTVAYKNLIFISDNHKGFYMEVFNSNGDYQYTIDKSSLIDRIQIENNNENKIFYPLLHHFEISSDKIYATTYKKIENKNEMIIMDLDGNILSRIFISMPSIKQNRGALRFDLFDVSEEKLYQVIKNDKTDKWELHITDL